MQTINRLAILIMKHLREELTSTDAAELEGLVAASEQNRRLFDQLTDVDYLKGELEQIYRFDKKEGWERLMTLQAAKKQPLRVLTISNNLMKAAAAVLLLIIATVAYHLINKKNTSSTDWLAQLNAATIIPDGDDAILKASDTSIVLNSALTGTLVEEDNIKVEKTKEYQLLYRYTGVGLKPASKKTDKKQHYNLLATPKSRQMDLTLTDSTQIKVNEATAIAYLPGYTEHERDIYMVKGEAFFHVAEDTTKPFRVKVNNIEIEALGTRFTVSAFTYDNVVRTTLEEGKLKITNQRETCYLHAGEQALLTNTDPIKVTSNKDTLAKALAWKKDFWFSRDGMETVMKQLEKWYHFTTVYKTNSIPQGEFTAGISKNEPLRGVLNSLEEKFHVRMEIRGNLVFVKPRP